MNQYISDSMPVKMGITSNLWKKHLHRAFKAYDITTDQWAVLRRLWQEEGIAQQTLSKRCHKDLPTLTRILNKLEKKGCISKVKSPDDLRTTLIYLSPLGKDLEAPLNQIASDILKIGSLGITREENALMMKILDKMILNLGGLDHEHPQSITTP